jgi:hypothetical protein
MLTMLFESPGPPATADDRATPENRRSLARKLLLGAIRRYEETCREWEAVHESFPKLDPPRPPSGPAEAEERSRWLTLLNQADENFNHAEASLAERIQVLVPMLHPAGRPKARDESDYFMPRAVRHAGSVYVLAYSAWEYEPKTNIVAVYRDSMAIEL